VSTAFANPHTHGVTPETRYAKSGDVHIAYQVIGSGAIDLVLIHAGRRSATPSVLMEK